MALLINWEVAPGALTNNRTTTLVAVVDDGTPLATQMGRHARAVRPPGLAGVLHIAYKWLMVLLGSAARVDGSSLLGTDSTSEGANAWSLATCAESDVMTPAQCATLLQRLPSACPNSAAWSAATSSCNQSVNLRTLGISALALG